MNLAKAIRMVVDAATLYDPDSEEMLEAAQTVFALARDPLPVLVILEGGRVRNVFTNVPAATIVVADYDHDGVPDEDLVTVWQGKGNSTKQASFCLQANEPLTGHVRDLVSWFIDRTSEDADD